VRATGVRDEALVDAIHVAALFNMIVRMADSLAFEVPPYESFLGRAERMLAEGYALEVLPDPADPGVEEHAQ
jgi:hypothetical protein